MYSFFKSFLLLLLLEKSDADRTGSVVICCKMTNDFSRAGSSIKHLLSTKQIIECEMTFFLLPHWMQFLTVCLLHVIKTQWLLYFHGSSSQKLKSPYLRLQLLNMKSWNRDFWSSRWVFRLWKECLKWRIQRTRVLLMSLLKLMDLEWFISVRDLAKDCRRRWIVTFTVFH